MKAPRGVTIVAALMMLFGVAEIVTAFTHRFFGVTTASVMSFTICAIAIGALYIAAGVLVLSMRRWAAVAAIVCLVLDVMGRIGLVAAGLYPLDSPKQIAAIVAGTLIAVFFAVYIASKWAIFATK